MSEQRDLVPIEDAAPRLGVGVDALRKRLERGKTLRGVKVGRQWFVDAADIPAPAHGVRTADVSVQEGPPDTEIAVSAASAVAKAIDVLTDQLAVKDRQITELLATIERLQIERLALPPAPPTMPPAGAQEPRRPWWRFW